MSQKRGRRRREDLPEEENPSPLPAQPAAVVSSAPPAFWYRSLFHVLLISVVGCAIYCSTLKAPFVFDDLGCIVENPAITDIRYLTDQTLLKRLPLDEDIYRNIILRPVAYLSFAGNYQLHQYEVLGYHLTNLLIHILNALLVYKLVLLTIKTPAFSRLSADPSVYPPVFAALFSALLFVSHPLQTQAVTYIVQRFATLATLFYLLSLVLYISSALSSDRLTRYSLYMGGLVSALLAMKTKEIAFTLPAVVCVYDLMFLRGSGKQRLLRFTPFLLTSLIIPLTVMRLAAGPSTGHAASVSHSMNLINYGNTSRWEYLYTQFRVVVTYLRLLFLPLSQNVDYDYPLSTSLFDPPVILSLAFLLVLSAGGAYLFYRSLPPDRPQRHWLRLISFGMFWFFVTLSVESSIIPIDDLIFEHRVYLPSVGFFVGCLASMEIIGTWGRGGMVTGKQITIVLCTVVVIASIAAIARNRVWRDPVTLWQDVARKSPNKYRPRLSLGTQYYQKGMLTEALGELQASLRLKPDSTEARHNIGNIYLELRRYDDAEREYREVIRLNPDREKAHNNLGYVLFLKGKYDEALFAYLQAVRINPYYIDPHFNLAELYEKRGLPEKAAREYEAVLRLNPRDGEVRGRLERLRR